MNPQALKNKEMWSNKPSDADAHYFRTDMEAQITIATYNNYRDTDTKHWEGTYQSFFNLLSKPDERGNNKDGKGYLIGPCNGRRIKSNMSYGCVAVIDADRSLNEEFIEEEGAPDPIEVHTALRNENISHVLYTTYSHGMLSKGNRYRVVFPVITGSEIELRGFLTYVVELLNEKYGINLVLSPESYRMSQLWQFPRVRDREASFISVSHVGIVPDPAYWANQYDFHNELSNRIPPVEGNIETVQTGSFYYQVDKYLPIQRQLLEAGYTYVSQGSQRNANGLFVNVQRWRKPNSDSAPGVVVFEGNNRTVLYSHHSNDPLAVGSACDALDVYGLLKGLNRDQAAQFAALEVQAGIADELNEEHPSVMLSGSEFRVANRVDDEDGGIEYKYMTWGNFQLYCSNKDQVWVQQPGVNDGNLVAISMDSFWKTCRGRKLYNGTTFVPSPLGSELVKEVSRKNKVYYNTFKGWTVAPKKGSWEYLEWHLRHAICGSNEEQYEYMLDWWAHLVQKPGEKPGVAVVLQGEKGAGKSMVFSRLIRALGKNSIVLNHTDQITNNFNSHLENRLIVMVEESFWSGNPQSEGVLKTLITDQHTTYTKKGVDSQEGRSYARVVMLTNKNWAAPVSGDERRYFLPTITDASINANRSKKYHKDGDFFPFLKRELEFGGVEAFYYDMMKRDIQGTVFSPPKTDSLSSQYVETLSGEAAWLFDILNDGEIRKAGDPPTTFSEFGLTLPITTIVDSMSAYLNKFENKHSSSSRVGKLLKKMLPTSHSYVNTPAGTSIRFLNLKVCRQEYQSKIRMKVIWRDNHYG